MSLSENRIPVIVLAIANDTQEGGRYLSKLKDELWGVRGALEEARKKGLCEIVYLPDSTMDQVFDIFQDETYRDRITIFHFGGHADGNQFVFESEDGTPKIKKAEGLVSFLSRQKSLQLIYLNACSTFNQMNTLLENGVPAVIGTDFSIPDDDAAALAERFYKGIGQGKSIEASWGDALDSIDIPESVNEGGLEWDDQDDIFFPWSVGYSEHNDGVKDWSIQDAAQSPLFGLPLPERYFQELLKKDKKNYVIDSPFRGIKRFEAEHAALFFGRGKEIKTLANRIRDEQEAPIILYFGQSGVGKSSLLAAGLQPRLESTHHIIYARRNEELGLLGSMEKALGEVPALAKEVVVAAANMDASDIAGLESVEEKLFKVLDEQAQKSPELEGISQTIKSIFERVKTAKSAIPPLLKQWKQTETIPPQHIAPTERPPFPLVIILDQVEEVFTKPWSGGNAEAELNTLFSSLKGIFNHPKAKPHGKIILAFRKEFQAEVEAAIELHRLHFSKLFLQDLDVGGAMEAIEGVFKSERLRNLPQFVLEPLKAEERLAEIIAEKIISDGEGRVAVVLQVLLQNMFETSFTGSSRAFTKDLYENFKDTLGLKHFFNDLMQEYVQANSETNSPFFNQEIFESGFLFDFLMEFVTDMGTAGISTESKLKKLYAHRKGILKPLIGNLIYQKLLLEIVTDGKKVLRLTHDSIAKEIQLQFELSNKPGQQVTRILDSKIRSTTDINQDELLIILKGASGRKIFSKEEKEPIANSKQENLGLVIGQLVRENQLELALNILFQEYSSSSLPQNFKVYEKNILVLNAKFKEINRRLAAGSIDKEIEIKELSHIRGVLLSLGNELTKEQNISNIEHVIPLIEETKFQESIMILQHFAQKDYPELFKELSIIGIRTRELKEMQATHSINEVNGSIESNLIRKHLTEIYERLNVNREALLKEEFEKIWKKLRAPKQESFITLLKKFAEQNQLEKTIIFADLLHNHSPRIFHNSIGYEKRRAFVQLNYQLNRQGSEIRSRTLSKEENQLERNKIRLEVFQLLSQDHPDNESPKELETNISKTEQLIQEGKIVDAFSLLIKTLQQTNQYSYFISLQCLKSRFHECEEKRSQGIAREEEIKFDENQLIGHLQEICWRLSDSYKAEMQKLTKGYIKYRKLTLESIVNLQTQIYENKLEPFIWIAQNISESSPIVANIVSQYEAFRTVSFHGVESEKEVQLRWNSIKYAIDVYLVELKKKLLTQRLKKLGKALAKVTFKDIPDLKEFHHMLEKTIKQLEDLSDLVQYIGTQFELSNIKITLDKPGLKYNKGKLSKICDKLKQLIKQMRERALSEIPALSGAEIQLKNDALKKANKYFLAGDFEAGLPDFQRFLTHIWTKQLLETRLLASNLVALNKREKSSNPTRFTRLERQRIGGALKEIYREVEGNYTSELKNEALKIVDKHLALKDFMLQVFKYIRINRIPLCLEALSEFFLEIEHAEAWKRVTVLSQQYKELDTTIRIFISEQDKATIAQNEVVNQLIQLCFEIGQFKEQNHLPVKEDKKLDILYALGSGELTEAFKRLSKQFSTPDRIGFSELLMLQFRFNFLLSKQKRGILEESTYFLERSIITSDLINTLEYLNELSPTTPTPSSP